MEPDILLLDEVLSTGDAAFREKSKQRVGELVREAKAIVLVTHDMNWVIEYCNRAMLIEKGHIVVEGSPEDVVNAAPGAIRAAAGSSRPSEACSPRRRSHRARSPGRRPGRATRRRPV